jgi:hypothetical protein
VVKDLLDRVDIWTLEGELAFANMLDLAINENTAPKSLALIALDLSQPWTLVETLQKWIKVLENHLDARSLRDEKSEGLGVPLLVVVNKVRPPPPPPASRAGSASPGVATHRRQTKNVNSNVTLPCTHDVVVVVCGHAIAV